MASNFPSSLDSFTNPSSTDAMDSVSVPHATQHSDLNDAVEALQAKVGADSSAVTTSHDYKIADHASRLTTLEALGDYTDYSGSISFTNFTLGNGTLSTYYTVVNDFVHFYGTIVLGSTSSVTGLIKTSLPFASDLAYPFGPNNCVLAESGVQTTQGLIAFETTVMRIMAANVVGSRVRYQDTSASIPFTWGAADFIGWNVVYRKV
jgi:hypothetical protein